MTYAKLCSGCDRLARWISAALSTTVIVLALIGVAAPAHAADPQGLSLKPAPMAEGGQILLGDVFENAGALADAVIGPAPEAGETLVLSARRLSEAVDTLGGDWPNPLNVSRVSIAREAVTITADDVAAFLHSELAFREGADLELQLALRGQTFYAPADAAVGLRLQALTVNSRTLTFTADVLTHDGAEPHRVTGRYFVLTDAPAPIRPIPSGQVIEAGDLEWIQVREDRLRADMAQDPADLVGMAARRTLRAGSPVRALDVRPPVTIAKNDLVDVVFETAGMRLTARARALEDAATGDMARLMNLNSNRMIEAEVTGPGQARVPLVGGFTLAAAP
ncbi:MAG: flagellar basal body P-ring formation chaperone FlgA [Maricaulaceae bacterium]